MEKKACDVKEHKEAPKEKGASGTSAVWPQGNEFRQQLESAWILILPNTLQKGMQPY